MSSLAELLFGRELRLALARWILHREPVRFYQSEVTAEMPSRLRTAVPGELARLIEAGMLIAEEPESGQRRRYYRRTSSPLWEIIEVSDRVFDDLGATSGRTP